MLTAACTADGGKPVVAAPATADAAVPTPTPRSSGALAYGLDGDIYVADSDGANAVRIADGRPPDEWEHGSLIQERCGPGEYWGEGPIWSPDGRYLAYRQTDCQAARDAWWDVVISDPEGNVLASFPSEGWLISWSPDSTRVATWVVWGKTIGIYGLDGVRQKVLTVPPGMMAPGDFDPVWSPDGGSLLVPNGVQIPLDGRTPAQLPMADPSGWWLGSSPNGSRIAYTAHRSLVVAAADGSHRQEAFGAGVYDLVWSPTGDRIAYVSNHSHQLRVLELGGREGHAAGIPDGIPPSTLLIAVGWDMLRVVDFSPEGDRILFSRTKDEGRGASSLWSINADGSGLRRLVTGTAWGDWWSDSQTR
jgi:Tol biopolymer transport system component